MSPTSSSLNDLIEVLNDGVSFYDDAVGISSNPECQALYRRLATTKRAIADELKGEVAFQGERPAEAGTLAGSLRKAYTELRASLSQNPEARYISQLEETEDRILHAFQDALTLSDNAQVRQIAQNHLPEIRRMHNEMRALKQHTPEA